MGQWSMVCLFVMSGRRWRWHWWAGRNSDIFHLFPKREKILWHITVGERAEIQAKSKSDGVVGMPKKLDIRLNVEGMTVKWEIHRRTQTQLLMLGQHERRYCCWFRRIVDVDDDDDDNNANLIGKLLRCATTKTHTMDTLCARSFELIFCKYFRLSLHQSH